MNILPTENPMCLATEYMYTVRTTVNDLKDWRYEGVIYTRGDDPLNVKDNMCLYAPDVTKGPDGRYYLFYALDKVSNISVAVCDTPAGKYEFYGYVHYEDGIRRRMCQRRQECTRINGYGAWKRHAYN